MEKIEMTRTADDRWLAGEAYDAYMGRWSRMVARAFVTWLHPAPAANWLEVGCGTGALTSALCELADPDSVVACDPSEPFVEHARRTLTDPRVSFNVADADTPPRRDGGFDGAVSGLVLNFLPNPEATAAALRERVRTGGILAGYVWDYSDGMEFLRLFWDEAVARDPGAAMLDEGRRFPLCQQAALGSLWQAAGLARVETHALEIPTAFATFEDYWTPFLKGTGPAPSYVASLDHESRAALRERLEKSLQARAVRGARLRPRAWAVRGVVTCRAPAG